MEGPHSAKTEDLPNYLLTERQVDFTMVRPKKAVNIKDGTYYMYLRKSRKDIEREMYGDMETLARHEADLDEVCERDGYPVEGKFKELVSGESISERKEFQKLMELVSQRKVSGVIVHAVDRLGRGSIDEYGWVLATLQRTRTLVITPGKVYDPTDSADYMALVMLMIISAGELAAQKERYRDGKNRSAKMGEFIGSVAPYGYDKVVIDRCKTLKPNDKADTVRMVFTKVASGVLPGKVANELNKKGIRTKKGKTWRPIDIKRMVRRVTYKGYIMWGETRVEELDRDGFESKKKQVYQEAEDVIIEKGLHEAIVSEDLWQAANDVVGKENHRTKADSTLKNPLAGVLRCGCVVGPDGEKCGHAVMLRTPANEAWTSTYRHRNYLACEGWRECNADAVIAMVVDSLMDIAGEFEMNVTKGEDESRKRGEELAAMRAELVAAERQAERLIDLYTADPPAITIEAFRRRNAALQEQIARLGDSIEEIESKPLPDYMELSFTVREVAETLKDPSYSAEHKNAMLKRVVDRIEIVNHSTERGKDDVEIHIFLRQ